MILPYDPLPSIIKQPLALSFCLGILFLAGCTPNQRIMESAPSPSSADSPTVEKPAKTAFETDVEAMRTADFRYIYVFRRKDGQPFIEDDKRLLGSGMPAEVNRRKLSDEGRALIVGSNFPMPDEDMEMLTDNFAFQDLSMPQPAESPQANNNVQ
ncbi:MAG: hypothetical protein KF685_10095 [Acidobacteria bacterium]|nr:hypothetical protein [Acidobacteriota bacterium]